MKILYVKWENITDRSNYDYSAAEKPSILQREEFYVLRKLR